jgi:16S rRNA (guanine527-N7)-methyltransferase
MSPDTDLRHRHFLMKEAADLLRRGIAELGISLTQKQVEGFTLYLAELRKWNRTYNLTGLKSDRDIVVKHFLDSLLFTKVFPVGIRTVADIGSGAGFPGMPIRIAMPDVKVFLIEPTKKKAAFLAHIRDKLGIADLEIITKRIEDIDGLHVDVCVTRALFTVGDFIRKTGAVVNKNGLLILNKGPKLSEELRGLDRGNITVSDFRLPLEDIVRHLVVVRT